jgi:hypothetical protein
MVWTDDAACARAAGPIEQASGTMPADVMESPDDAIVAAHGEQHFAVEIEALVIAGVGNFRDVTDNLPGRAEDALALERKELGVRISPGGQAEIVRRKVIQSTAGIWVSSCPP